jgi:hypothetical protein
VDQAEQPSIISIEFVNLTMQAMRLHRPSGNRIARRIKTRDIDTSRAADARDAS